MVIASKIAKNHSSFILESVSYLTNILFNVCAQCNAGFLSNVILLNPLLLPLRNPIKCHEEVLSLQPMIPPKCFDIFSH